MLSAESRAGKNLRFLKKVFRFLGFFMLLRFLGFNVYAQSPAEHWMIGHKNKIN